MAHVIRDLLKWAVPCILLLGVCTATGETLAQRAPALAEALALEPGASEPSVCAASLTGAGTTYEIVLPALQDSYVSSSSSSVNYGTATSLVVGSVKIPVVATYRTFLAFDLASLPADAVIVTATLELYQTGGSGTFSMDAQRVTASWTEAGITYSNQPGTTTADQASGYLGGDGWVRWNLTPMVRKWAAGTASNYGARISFGTGTNGSKTFNAREATADQPRLVVRYQRTATLNVQADTDVSQSNPTANQGNASELVVRDGSASNASYALLSFDVSAIPAGSTVVSASLGLFPYFAMAQAVSDPVELAPQALSLAPEAALGSWSEMVVTWNSKPASASQGDPALSWVDSTWNWLDVTKIAQAWVSGALTNYGIMLKPATGSTGTAMFEARPNSTEARLIIVYGPPPCYEATSTTIGGATQGVVDTEYTFNASVSPANATGPFTYTWQATDQGQTAGSSASMDYTWSIAGWKTITVTVENCGSSVQDTHLISVTTPPPACPIWLTGVSLSGPTTGYTGTLYPFTATPIPANATSPVTYTWQATGQPNYTGSQSTRAYTWSTPGTQTVIVTARNCGGEAVQQMTVDVAPRADLTVPAVWYNLVEGRVNYAVENTGGGAAPAGHMTRLYRDGVVVAAASFSEILAPGSTRSGSIAYTWTCAGDTAQMKVCADGTNTLPEGSEANNCFEETWPCDVVPPQITSGPEVTSRTQHGAVISWTTDEPCKTRLDYGKYGPFGLISMSDATYKTNHQVTLTDLSTASTYWYRITIEDGAGNLNTSGDAYFETQPIGTDPVAIGEYGILDYPSGLYEFFTLYADVTNEPAGVDRISFFLDGQLIGRDESPTGNRFEVYVSPAALGLSRADWFRSHPLQVQAYNLEGEAMAAAKSVTPESAPVSGRAVIVNPDAGYTQYIDGATAPAGTTLDVSVYGVEYAWKCTEGGYVEPGEVPPGLAGVDCGDVRTKVTNMKLYLDDNQVGVYAPPADAFSHTFEVSLAGKSAGAHALRFVAQLSGGAATTAVAEHEITLVQGRGDLALGHRAERDGNVFNVTLTLTNTGTSSVYVDNVDDYASGFQVIEKGQTPAYQVTVVSASAGTPYYTVTSSDWGDTADRRIMVDFYASDDAEKASLAPGASLAVTYQLVPILYEGYTHYYVGSGGATASQASLVKYQITGVPGTFLKWLAFGDNWVDGLYIDQAVQQAFATADYLLITSPAGLRVFADPIEWRTSEGTQRELNLLLSRMAELAALKQGVLGFLPLSPSGDTLDDLLERNNGYWGAWANALHPNFRQNEATGYVLLVGEQEIIPAQTANYGVNFSDLPYASTTGQNKPELILGRIVGNDLGTLRKPIETSLAFHRTGAGFDRSHAIGVSGRGRGEGTFWDDIKAVAGTMADSGIQVTKIRWKVDNAPSAWDYFKTKVAEIHPDIIIYSGHGNPDGWHGLGSNQVGLLDHGASRPVAVGFACETGNYEDPGDDDYSLPEAWLRYNGSIYIGSSDTTYDYPDSDAARAFVSRWEAGEAGRNVGQVFTYLKRDKWSIDSDWREWAFSYHLFGDPKFGAMPGMQVQAMAPVVAQGASTLSITIPDFVVSTTDAGLDAVEIPGGELMGEAGVYRIPYWTASYVYPQGQRVQGVALALQSGLVVTTGLHLPTTTMEIRCPNCLVPTAVHSGADSEGWVPNRATPYDWQVAENPDGTSTLELKIYPFSYYSSTTAVRFYQDWEFDVDVAASTVNVLSLGTTQATYRMADTVVAPLVLENTGSVQPVMVWADIRSDVTGDIVETLPLRTLHAVTGTTSVDLTWSPGGAAAGPYALEVKLVGEDGRTLDTEVVLFARGVAAAEVVALAAASETFEPGDAVGLSMTLQNTGDVPLSGMVVLQVATSDGLAVSAVFTQTVVNLAPGATVAVQRVWDTTGALAVDHTVSGYLKYDGGASAPRKIVVAAGGGCRVYLPLTLRQ